MEAPFPESKEKLGRFVGISESVGDALTFKILTDDTGEIIHRSVVRPADDPKNPNPRVFPDGIEAATTTKNIDTAPAVYDIYDAMNMEPGTYKLPSIDPDNIIGTTFLREREVDGSVHRAEVIKRLENMDGQTDQYLVSLGDGKRQDVMTYGEIIDIIERQNADEIADEDKFWSYKAISGHRKVGRTWEVLVKWEDGSESWEPLSAIKGQDPVTLAIYAKDNDLLDTEGWK